MKRFFALLLGALLAVSLFTVPAFAENPVEFSVTQAVSELDKDVEIAVAVKGAYEANSVHFYLEYNPAHLAVVEIAEGEVFDAYQSGGPCSLTAVPGEIQLAAVAPTEPFTAEGVIFTVKFHVAADAPLGEELPITLAFCERDGFVQLIDRQFINIEHTDVDGYIRTTANYTITWKNEDGEVLDTTVVAYGEMPEHEDLVKEADAQYTYTFAGWEPEIVPAKADAEYTAKFDKTVNKYPVKFYLNDGTDAVFAEAEVEYGAAAVKPETDPAREGFEFTGWFADKEAAAPWDFETVIKEETAVYAGWKEAAAEPGTDPGTEPGTEPGTDPGTEPPSTGFVSLAGIGIAAVLAGAGVVLFRRKR